VTSSVAIEHQEESMLTKKPLGPVSCLACDK